MKIVTTGLGRSGSTALYSLIRASMQGEVTLLFEPRNRRVILRAGRHARDVLVKNLKFEFAPCFAQYDRKIYLARDPRDYLVSRLLYGSAFHTMFDKDPEEIARLAAVYREKEAMPGRRSLCEIHALAGIDIEVPLQRCAEAVAFFEAHPDYFLVKYEDLVAGELSALETYLGMPLQRHVEVEAQYARVARTRQSGSWRSWFTGEDVRILRPRLAGYMKLFGYDDRDWELAESASIPPEHCSRYFLKVLNERRSTCGLEPVYQ